MLNRIRAYFSKRLEEAQLENIIECIFDSSRDVQQCLESPPRRKERRWKADDELTFSFHHYHSLDMQLTPLSQYPSNIRFRVVKPFRQRQRLDGRLNHYIFFQLIYITFIKVETLFYKKKSLVLSKVIGLRQNSDLIQAGAF
jgi:hypothetical protein